MVANNGYPIWNKSFSQLPTKSKKIATHKTSSTQDTIVVIPFAFQSSSSIAAYIEAHINDSLKMAIFNSNYYKNLNHGSLNPNINNAEKFAYRFMLLERKVFNHVRYKILDSNLFKNAFNQNVDNNNFRFVKLNSLTNTTKTIGAGDNVDDFDTETNPCIEIWYDPTYYSDPCHCSGDEFFHHYEGDCGSGGGGGSFDWGYGSGWGEFGYWFTGNGPYVGGSSGSSSTDGGSPTGWLSIDASANPTLAGLANSLNTILQLGDSYYFDNTLDISNSLSFNTVEEFKDYKNNFTSNAIYDNSIPAILNPTADMKTDFVKVQYSAFPPHYGVEFAVSCTKNTDNTWSFNQITSEDYGVTIIWSWSQSPNPTVTTKNNEITIDVSGYIKINVFLEGIGTVYKMKRSYRIKVSTLTGEITSIIQL